MTSPPSSTRLEKGAPRTSTHRGSTSTLRTLLAAAATFCALAPRAYADSPPSAEYTRQTYPLALIDRPLILPRKMVQLRLDSSLGNMESGVHDGETSNPAVRSESAVSSTLGVGVDVGIANGWQLGVNTEILLTPRGMIGTFEANVQRRVTRWLSVRADLGLQVTQLGYWSAEDGDESSFHFSMVAGVALPLKLELNRYVALVSGDAAARNMGAPPYIPLSSHWINYGGPFSDDLLTLLYDDYGRLSGSVYVPLGLVVQPHPRVAVGVRAGYRVAFSEPSVPSSPWDMEPTGESYQHFVPLDVDVVVSPLRQLDVGLRAQIQGRVGQSGNIANTTLPLTAWPIGWGDVRQLTSWITYRI